jgi:SAM-dependent methyltransferase
MADLPAHARRGPSKTAVSSEGDERALGDPRPLQALARRLDPRWAIHRLRGRVRGNSAEDWEDHYARADDPYEYEKSPREHARYRFLLGVLADRPLGRTLELGCSVGVLTATLAERSTSLVATDISETAIATTGERLRGAGRDGVELRTAALPGDLPEGPFDTILASDVLCYLVPEEVKLAAGRMAAALAPGGRLLVSDTRGYFPTHAVSADHAARLVARTPGLRGAGRWGGSRLRVDLFERRE